MPKPPKILAIDSYVMGIYGAKWVEGNMPPLATMEKPEIPLNKLHKTVLHNELVKPDNIFSINLISKKARQHKPTGP